MGRFCHSRLLEAAAVAEGRASLGVAEASETRVARGVAVGAGRVAVLVARSLVGAFTTVGAGVTLVTAGAPMTRVETTAAEEDAQADNKKVPQIQANRTGLIRWRADKVKVTSCK
jgi:hypothetical protein